MSETSLSPVRINLPRLVALRAADEVRLPPVRRVLAVQAGGYRSRFRGRGMEFAEVRAYQPGDDVRSIDWRVTARRGEVHTKLFHEERETPVLLVLDYRRPMFFRHPRPLQGRVGLGTGRPAGLARPGQRGPGGRLSFFRRPPVRPAPGPRSARRAAPAAPDGGRPGLAAAAPCPLRAPPASGPNRARIASRGASGEAGCCC